jgi:hypothetical protein
MVLSYLGASFSPAHQHSSAKSSFLIDPLQKGDSTKEKPIQLYHLQDLASCPWPEHSEGVYLKKFLTPLMQEGIHNYIENVHSHLFVLVWGDLILPLTMNDGEYDNSYVCSPYSYYFSYAQQSLHLLTQFWTRYTIQSVLWGTAKVLKGFQINKVIIVNNWPFSTTLYPQLQSNQVKAIAHFLQERFPQHAIVFRSVDPHTNPVCYETLQQVGFSYIAHRQIFFIRPQESGLLDARLFKSDRKLLDNSGYEILDHDDITEADIPRLLNLYLKIYIHKYSTLNPQFNENFLRLMLTHHLMHFKALKKNGRIDGVIGYVERNGMMFCPFFGYDLELPKEQALYRLLSTVLMLEASQRQFLFHQSSGASAFKLMRKATSCIEYLAVYHKHLNLSRKLPWMMLKGMCNSLGIFYMKRY